jgi:hypothetical protein
MVRGAWFGYGWQGGKEQDCLACGVFAAIQVTITECMAAEFAFDRAQRLWTLLKLIIAKEYLKVKNTRDCKTKLD